MATKKQHPGRTLIVFLVIVLALAGTLTYGTLAKKTNPYPNLALDLEGGTQLILTPKAKEGKGRQVSSDDIQQAIEVIRQRVDASGVSEAEITSQGQSNILVALPGNPSQDTLDLVRKSAELFFRPVLRVGQGQALTDLVQAQATTGDSKEEGAKQPVLDKDKLVQEQADLNKDGKIEDTLTSKPEDASSDAYITEKVLQKFYSLNCLDKKAREGGDNGELDKAIVACSVNGHEKYILGPVEVAGKDIKNADAGMGRTPQGQPDGRWVVDLTFNSKGAKQFEETSTRLFHYRDQTPQSAPGLPPNTAGDKNRFAIVLDGLVVSAPGIVNPISNGSAEISGSFTRSSATALANQLKFGSLPLSFEVQSEQQVSATLGADQLYWGVLAGIIGLILVVVYLTWQYRGLSIVAVGSLVGAGVILYLVLALLSWGMGYRLSLAGVAGVIVSIGTTADSFIVYFERVRDEVRDGRPLVGAVEEGWRRAKRTIIASDAVNILAALVLYFLAVGGVQGFAFTLGVTTAIDLALIFLFTHPMMQMLIRLKFFGNGHKLSGLDPEHLGAQVGTYRYVGAGQVRKVRSVYKPKESDGSQTDAKADEKVKEA